MPRQRPARSPHAPVVVERVQTGIRIEKRMLKTLKALAEHLDLTLGDLIEGIVLHAFEGRPPFGHDTRRVITQLRAVYGLDLGAEASHRMSEATPAPAPPARRRRAAGRKPAAGR